MLQSYITFGIYTGCIGWSICNFFNFIKLKPSAIKKNALNVMVENFRSKFLFIFIISIVICLILDKFFKIDIESILP